MKYVKMTQQEFDDQHYEIIEWYKLWSKLFWIGFVFFIITLFFDRLEFSAATIGAQLLFLIGEYVCRYKHDKLHERWEREHGE